MTAAVHETRSASETRPLLVNLGCGGRIHADWANYDLSPTAPGIRRANFISGIPLHDASADCVYHSHLLEHLPESIARRFLLECKRVLKPGGILRVVVPDLEQIARDYVAALDRRRGADSEEAREAHRWMTIEMVDQLVRSRPGGEFGAMLDRGVRNPAFIEPRLGSFGRGRMKPPGSTPSPTSRYVRALDRIERWLPKSWGYLVSEMLYRRLGEVHRWMYDELSLADLLTDLGYVQVQRAAPTVSRIPGWLKFHLDADPDGTQYKGVSLYMEAVKPTDERRG